MDDAPRDRTYDVAVVGMAGRFPGAADVEELRRNLAAGRESISVFTVEELLDAGVDASLLADPRYVRVHPVLDEVELFDAAFFGFNPREAQMIDPQQRLFLECAWQALENAGHVPETYPGRIGVFAGASINTYLLSNVLPNPALIESFGGFQTRIASDKDFLPTRVSYKLNLRGPSLAVQTACSTSLVAVHVACQSLLNRECDMALAGGATVHLPQQAGYLYEEGGIESPDGRCRPFDAGAGGTVFGSGVAVVVLKRLADALADGNPVRAVIRGSAVNNDGAAKVGFTAPGIEGQAEVIAEALAMAGIEPETVTAVEAHGTATAIGDVIEVAALKKVFGDTGRKGFCALGSVKSNFGHLDSAAGVTGLIKAVLSLEERKLFPTLHFERPNPELRLADSPFYVSSRLQDWDPSPLPRRIGVSSFGIGGTNAHVVLEEAPAAQSSSPSRAVQLLTLSARTPAALEAATARLAAYLEGPPGSPAPLPDVAYTLHLGRKALEHRRAVVVREGAPAAAALTDPRQAFTGAASKTPTVGFLFSGQGAQHVAMGAGLYRDEPVFREALDRCAELLAGQLAGPAGVDLRAVLFPAPGAAAEASRRLEQTDVTQPALFALEYALASVWRRWGVQPQAMLGHSVGEYVAACLAGVMTLKEALGLVAARGRLMQGLPPGAMAMVPLPEPEVAGLLGEDLSLAAVNGPSHCVVSGPEPAVAALGRSLSGRGVECRRLRTTRAFHSAMMEPILEPFLAEVRQVALKPPAIRYVSNVTGTWITADEATSPDYYGRHLRRTVRFSAGLAEILREPDVVLLEVGPGSSLTALARRHCDRARGHVALASMRHPQDEVEDLEALYGALGRSWVAGVQVSWEGFWQGERRRRVALPTYPFERQRFWIEPAAGPPQVSRPAASRDLTSWFHLPSWRRSMTPRRRAVKDGHWLVFADRWGLGERIAERLRREGARVTVVREGSGFAEGDGDYQADPRRGEDVAAVWRAMRERGAPDRVLYLWSFWAGPRARDAVALLREDLDAPFLGLLGLGQALFADPPERSLPIWVVTNHLQSVTGGEVVDVARATVLGPCRALPVELPAADCRQLDLEVERPDGPDDLDRAAAEVLAEACAGVTERAVAYRGRQRWVESFEPLRLEGGGEVPARLRRGGVYLITGGLGSMGLAFARYLVEAAAARLVLVGRSALPPRREWEELLASLPGADPLRRRLEGLLALEAAGAEVLVVQADVADRGQMQAACDVACQRFGGIDGAIHAAGVLGQGIAALKTPADAAAVLAPKVLGSLVLDAVLAPLVPDFVLLCSSRSAVAPLPGQVDYCAANAFLDALAHLRAATGGPPTIAVDWGFWQELGMAARADLPPELEAEMAAGIERLRVEGLADAGVRALARILAECTAPQVVVSREPVDEHLAAMRALAASAGAPARPPRAPRAGAAAVGSYVPPRGEVEERIAETWQDLLGIDRVGADDDFFVLGGHSLLATRLLARIKETFRVDIPLRAIFDASTVARLAAAVEAARRAGVAPAPSGGDDGGSSPLSFPQLRLWYLDRLNPGGTGYNSSLAVRLTGALDAPALVASLREVVRRHEPLRTTFAERDGEPVQRVGPPGDVPLPLVDLSALDGAAGEASRIATRELEVPFDLARGPLLRVLLLRLGAAEHVLVVEMPHIVTDAWSVAVLRRDLALAYDAFARRCAPRLPELASRYVDFARWQRRLVEGGGLDAQLAYWRRRLDGLPSLRLPLDRPRPPVQSLRGRARTLRLPRPLAASLRAASRRPETTLFMVLLTAFAATLVHWTGQEEVVVGCNFANRDRAGAENLVGLFLNMLVWRADLSGDPTFLEALDRVRRVTLEAYANAEVPFDRLVEALRPERSPSIHPLFQVKVDFQNLPIEVPRPAGVAFAPYEIDFGRVHNDLTLAIVEAGEDLVLTFEYAVDLFEEATIAALAERYEMALAAVVADPEVRVGELVRRLREADRRRRLAAEAAFKEPRRARLKQATRRAVGPLSRERHQG